MDGSTELILAEMRALHDELKTLREETKMFREETHSSFETLNVSVTEIRQSVSVLSSRVDVAETRIAGVEHGCSLTQRLVTHLLKKGKQLESYCEMLECQSRRNSLRIFGCAEGLESGNVVKWGDQFIKEVLELPHDTDLRLERMHRSLGKKPDPPAPPRSFIAKFLDHQTKEMVLSKAWQSNNLKYQDCKINFDRDYPPLFNANERSTPISKAN